MSDMWTCALASSALFAGLISGILFICICKATMRTALAIALAFGLSAGSCHVTVETCSYDNDGT